MSDDRQGPQFQTAMMSNLITDMIIAGAPMTDLERAVKHSVIAIEYDKSTAENDIASLVKKYQS